jgi:hypothetical protein
MPLASVYPLVTARAVARAEGDFQRADQLRAAIREAGYAVRDTRSGPVVVPRDPDEGLTVISTSTSGPDFTGQPDDCDFSVNLLAHNSRADLQRCVESVARHGSGRKLEIVIVDNGSSDRSLELVSGFRMAIRTIELGRNTGFAYAANRGIEAANAEAVALVNTDVVLAPDWLEQLTPILEAEPGLAGVACKMVQMGDEARLYDAGDILRRDGA